MKDLRDLKDLTMQKWLSHQKWCVDQVVVIGYFAKPEGAMYAAF